MTRLLQFGLSMKRTRWYVEPMAHPAVHTADELLRLDIPGKCTELVRGRLIVREPPGYRHGQVGMQLALAMADFVRSRDLGVVLALETGFKLASDPDTVRAPDVAFISRERVPEPPPTGYATLAPDLIVEVRSPNDRAGYVLGKVGDWLVAGSRLVWVVDPAQRSARVYRADGSEALVANDGTLDGEDVLPGFSCQLAGIL
jgi:Uma2 family endonuclease